MTNRLIMLVSFLMMVIISIAANLIPFHDRYAQGISDSYTLLIFPTKYVFMLLYFVYIAIFCWLILQFIRKTNFNWVQTFLFSASFITNLVWGYCWSVNQFGFGTLWIFLAVLFIGLFYLTLPINELTLKGRLPITLYFAWFTYSFMLHLNFIFTYYQWSGFGLTQPLWAVIFLTAGAAIALHVRYHYNDIAFPLVFMWAYLGIAIKTNFDELLVTTSSLFLCGTLLVGILFFKKNNKKKMQS